MINELIKGVLHSDIKSTRSLRKKKFIKLKQLVRNI